MARHIVIDNSNIYGGAQRAAETVEPGALWMAVRVYYKNLFALLEHPGGVMTRTMAGSVPPGNEELWEYANKLGYDTQLLKKVEKDEGGLGEQGVDEMLHLKISDVLLDYRPPQTLVLATGDGKQTPHGNSFVRQVERALDHGWEVEIWSWQAQLSSRFSHLRSPTGRAPSIKTLDPYYYSVTFTRTGQYTVKGSSVSVAGRVVAPLRLASC
jgi:hypothetical protein